MTFNSRNAADTSTVPTDEQIKCMFESDDDDDFLGFGTADC